MKPLHEQCALLADQPSMFQGIVVLEGNDYGGHRHLLYEGSLEIAERVVACWNAQLNVPTSKIKHPSTMPGWKWDQEKGKAS